MEFKGYNSYLKGLPFAVYHTIIGFVLIVHNGSAVVCINILTEQPTNLGYADTFTDMVISQIREYLNGTRQTFSFATDITHCTQFQQKVLTQLTTIPYGETCSYHHIATAIGNPKASRAVGLANSLNPIHIAIPCHRVISKNGKLNGYAGGVDAKRYLLDIEQQRIYQ